MDTVAHFIQGKVTLANSSRKQAVFNPALGTPVREVVLADKSDIDFAVAAAKAALPHWSAVTPLRRARIMFRFKELLQQHFAELVALITEEHGKTLSDAHGELTRGMEVVEVACGIPDLLKGDYSADVGTNVDSYSMRQPVGVCAGITPFNFPAMVGMWMFPMAIACGNTFILKPSERDPSIAVRLAELLHEAGLPAGVFNVVQGDKEAVDAILQHPDIATVSFVGSTPVARYIYEQAAKHGKRVQALGGAKNHCVVMPDANLELAANGLMGAAYGSAGERCMAISVAVAVGEQTANALVKCLSEKLTTLKIKSGTAEDAEMGPLISQAHLARVKDLVAHGVDEGATLVVDGRNVKAEDNATGFFMGGCLFDHVKPSMSIYQEEIFGPVLCVVRVNNFKEALTLINANPYANGTSIYTQSGAVSHEFAKHVTVGMVGINIPIPVPMAFHSFGGWKQSFFGDTEMHGHEAVRFYTRIKTVTASWPMEALKSEFVIPTSQ